MLKRTNDQLDGTPLLRDATTQCMYPGKTCLNQRVFKTTGELHKFCKQHQDSANVTKRKSQLTKKMKLEEEILTRSTCLTQREPAVLNRSTGASAGMASEARDAKRLCIAAEDLWQCTYSTGKHCPYVRTKKSTGELHRFCEYHAWQARLDQRISVGKKRGSFDATSDPAADVSVEPEFCCPHGACEVPAATGLHPPLLNSIIGDNENQQLGALSFDVNNAQSSEALTGFLDDSQYDQVMNLRLQIEPADQRAFGARLDISSQVFQFIGDMRPHERQAVFTPHGLGFFNLPIGDITTKDAVDLIFDSIDEIQSSGPVYGLMDHLREDDVDLLGPHLPLWLLDFIDEICASLS